MKHLKVILKTSILNFGFSEEGGGSRKEFKILKTLGVKFTMDDLKNYIEVYLNVEELLNYSIGDKRLLPYVDSFEYTVSIKDEMIPGRYQLGTAKGRVTKLDDGSWMIFLGSKKLSDLQMIVQKIELKEIQPGKIIYDFEKKCWCQNLLQKVKNLFN